MELQEIIERQAKEIDQLKQDKTFFSYYWETIERENTKLKELLKLVIMEYTFHDVNIPPQLIDRIYKHID